MKVVTRFAPSPTGFLHIGGARTALFNYLFARHHEGIFQLRIEDTDRARSTEDATKAIISGLEWLGLHHDGEVIYQSQNIGQHQKVGAQLYEKGHAYYCDCTPEMLEEDRAIAMKQGQKPGYNGRCRHRNLTSGALRLKTPEAGETTLQDLVQGTVTIQNNQIDDMVMLRSDGTPTYMLSVVVDDYTQGVTHIIRGDDHLTNAFRQAHIYQAMHWPLPQYAHIPLIHGEDGAKLSKRHGAIGVDAYESMGYLPQAIRNYLLRLGWGHGDDEIISDAQAIEWFTLQGVGKSPARFDFKKLDHLNAHYMRCMDNERLFKLIKNKLHHMAPNAPAERLQRVINGMNGLKERATNLNELAQNALFYIQDRPLPLTEQAKELFYDTKSFHQDLKAYLTNLTDWTESGLEEKLRLFSAEKDIKLGKVAQALRTGLTGSHISPSVFEIMAVLGQDETIKRLQDHMQ